MNRVIIDKVTVNIGVGEGGERLAKAEKLLERLTGRKPVRTIAKSTNQNFGIRKGQSIGCKVTLRNKDAENFLRKALSAVDNKIKESSIDEFGNFSFGIEEYIYIPGEKYDPNIGIFGMDVSVAMKKPGYRVKRRRIARSKVGKRQKVTRKETKKYISEKFGVSFISEE